MESTRFTRALASIRLGRRLVLAVVTALIASGVVVVTVLAASNGPAAPTPKQIARQQMAAQATAASMAPHAAKHPQPPVTSCPMPPETSHVIPPGYGPTNFHQDIVNSAKVLPSPNSAFEYMVYAGALQSNARQGILIVVRFDRDPCQPGAPGTQITTWDTAQQDGALTLTGVSGGDVTFTTQAGTAGTFDVPAGRFGA